MRFSVLPHKDNTFSPNSPTPHPKTHNTNNLQKPQKSRIFSIIYPHNRQHHNAGTSLGMFRCNSAMFNASPNMPRHVPTLWRYRFGEFDTVFYQEIILSSGGMDRSEIHGIDFRFSTFGGGSLVWWQN
ncbi:MAG: hypothetical protein SPF86_04690 [Sodaliphilus sp.]|nr:hypothetical protein [Sodaliphilus sp.]